MMMRQKVIDEASGESDEKNNEKKYQVYDDRLRELEEMKGTKAEDVEESLARDERADLDIGAD